MSRCTLLLEKIQALTEEQSKVLGFTDVFTTCELCGKKNLKGTYAFEIDGVLTYYGSECITKRFGTSKEKLKRDVAKAEDSAIKKFDFESSRLPEKKVLDTILHDHDERNKRKGEIEALASSYVSKRDSLYKELIAPYPSIAKKYQNQDTVATILKKVDNADWYFKQYGKDSETYNSANMVW